MKSALLSRTWSPHPLARTVVDVERNATLNTLANIVTAVCAVLLAIKVL